MIGLHQERKSENGVVKLIRSGFAGYLKRKEIGSLTEDLIKACESSPDCWITGISCRLLNKMIRDF